MVRGSGALLDKSSAGTVRAALSQLGWILQSNNCYSANAELRKFNQNNGINNDNKSVLIKSKYNEVYKITWFYQDGW